MSGGSFNYACFSDTAQEIFRSLDDFRNMEKYLRSEGQHSAADEVLLFVKELETHERRLMKEVQRLHELFYASEWAASGDYSIDAVDKAYWKLMGMEVPKHE